MGQPTDIDARRYWRVALQRQDEAHLILESLELPKPAVYLAGYAVECILKALLIHRTPDGQKAACVAKFRGAKAHDLLWLRDLLRAQGTKPSGDVNKHLLFVSDWSTDLRYEPGPGDREDAQAFLASVRAIVYWANNGI